MTLSEIISTLDISAQPTIWSVTCPTVISTLDLAAQQQFLFNKIGLSIANIISTIEVGQQAPFLSYILNKYNKNYS